MAQAQITRFSSVRVSSPGVPLLGDPILPGWEISLRELLDGKL